MIEDFSDMSPTGIIPLQDILTILKRQEKNITLEEIHLVEKAYQFAEKAHEGQLRKSGAPYFEHITWAGKYTAEFGMDAVCVAAALLHDTVEDTSVTSEEIETNFGTEIKNMVEGVTKLGHLKYQGRERHVESMRNFFLASAKDPRVILIKLADRLHNVKTLEHLPEEKRRRIALETIEIHSNLAWRLGMGRLTGELQDAAFKYAYPKEYKMTEKLLKTKRKTDYKYIEKIYRSLKKEMALQGIKDIKTHYRIKKMYSLFRKLQKKEMDIEKIYDIVAIRVIVPTVEDCYRVLGIIHNMWKPLPGRIKDFIALPKTNGYQSLHTTIFTGDGGITEIQIRTPEMHKTAEYGIAAHFIYKNSEPGEESASQKTLLSSLGFMQDIDAIEFDNNVKNDLSIERIFVFTPKGDVIDLPEGSSVIDFAFMVHSEVGFHASSAKVNGKFVPLKTILKNGDIVEIETKDSSHPSSKWLDFTKSTFARRKIQKYIREKETDGPFSFFFKKKDKNN